MGGASYPGPMPPEVNRPDVVADIGAVFERYEAALVANDVDVLDELFWDSPHVVRFGLADRQQGVAEVSAPACRSGCCSWTRSSVIYDTGRTSVGGVGRRAGSHGITGPLERSPH